MKYIRNFVLSILIISMISVISPLLAFAESPARGSAPSIIVSYNYDDVKGGWYEDSANLYGYREIFAGEDGLFHPGQRVTRLEFVRMLHKALGININYFAATDIGDYYDDVTNDTVGAGDLYDLVTCGIIDTKGSFRPSAQLDRDEMIHFVMEAFCYSVGGVYAIPAIEPMPFADDSEINSEYHIDVSRSVILGLIKGVGSNLLRPSAGATRAEAVTAAGRLVNLLKNYRTSVNVDTSANEIDGQLHMTLSIANNTEKTVAIDHMNGQKFDFVIRDENGNELYRWSDGQMFTMASTLTVIEPGKEAAFSSILDAEAYSTIKGNITSITGYFVGTSSDFTVYPDGYPVSGVSFTA